MVKMFGLMKEFIENVEPQVKHIALRVLNGADMKDYVVLQGM